MTIIATCSCGESFAAPPSLAGKKAKCPSCAEVITIPSAPASQGSSKPASARPAQEKSGRASNSTGSNSTGAKAAGKNPAVKKSGAAKAGGSPSRSKPKQPSAPAQKPTSARTRPSTSAQPIQATSAEADGGVVELQRPGSPANVGLESNDVFGLGDLNALETPPNDPLGTGPLEAQAGGPAAPRQGTGAPVGHAPAGTAAGWNAQKQGSSGGGSGLIIAIIGGVAAIFLIAIVGIVIAVLMMGGDTSEVADNETGTGGDPSADLANPVGTQNTLNSSGSFGGTNQNSGFGGSGLQNQGSGFQNQGSGFGQGDDRLGPNDNNEGDSGSGGSDDSGSGAFGQGEVNTAQDNSMAQGAVNWHSQKGRKLRGAIEVPDVDLVIYHYSWLCDLLPYMGHQSVYDQFNFEKRFIESPNVNPSVVIIPQFLNPHDDRERCKDIRFPEFALTHFAGMSGVEDEPNDLAAEYPRSNLRAGIFGYDEIAREEDITDGLSDTIMIVGTGRIAQPWVAGGGATIRGARPPYFGKLNGIGSQGLAEPGVMVVMADGSIRHISADIDPRVFKALCTTHGAEEVDMNSSKIGKLQADWFVQ